MRPWLLFVVGAASALAQSDAEHFEKKVRPLFAAKCQQCHGAKMQMGGLNLATGAGGHSPNLQRLPANSKVTGPLQPLVLLIVPKCWPALSEDVHVGAPFLGHAFAILHIGAAQVKKPSFRYPAYMAT